MSLLGKGVNKLFTSLGSLLKKIVELLFDLLGFIKFKISKKGYNVREESSKNGKIVGRRLKNNMDKFAIKAQVETDKGMIFLGKFLRLFTFNILKLFNTVSRNLYKASEKSKDKFTTYNISQDEKNKEKFIEFDNLIAKCNDIENYAEAAISKNVDNSYKDLDKTLFEFPNTYHNSNNNNIEKYEKNSVTDLDKTLYEDLDSFNNLNKNDDSDLDKTLFENDDDMFNSIKSEVFSKTLKDINSATNINENKYSKNEEICDLENHTNTTEEDEEIYNSEDDIDTIEENEDVFEENTQKKHMFDFLKKKEQNSSLDETFHGENYEFNSSIKLANENYSKNKNKSITNKSISNDNFSKKQENSMDKTQLVDLESLKENESDKTRMVNIDDFREAVNSRLNSSNNTDNKIKNSYRYSLDDDDESIRKFLNDD